MEDWNNMDYRKGLQLTPKWNAYTGQIDKMAKTTSVADSLTWMADEQLVHEYAEFGSNKKAVDDALKEQQRRARVVGDYSKEVDKVVDGTKEEEEKKTVASTYENLSLTANRRLGCLTGVARIAGLEEAFGRLSVELAECGASLVADAAQQGAPQDGPAVSNVNADSVSKAAQSCILGVRANWQWLSTLVKCTDVHLKHVSEYHEFFHDAKEYETWLPADLTKAQSLVQAAELTNEPDAQSVARLFFELKTALSLFLHWQYKLDDLFQRSRQVVPVQHRTTKLDHHHPIKALCHYKTKEIQIREGEELTLLDNTHKDSWLVRNMHHKQSQVPSVICVIPPPDTAALEAAMRLRLQLLAEWTNNLRRIGQTVIGFLLAILKDWTPEEEKLISALNPDEKAEVRRMLDAVQTALGPYWSDYPDYQTLEKRMDRLRYLLDQEGDPKYREEAAKRGKALIIQIGTIDELLKRYGDLWKHWETYKIMVETSRHPELLLVCKDVDCMKFIDFADMLKKWNLRMDGDGDGTDGTDGSGKGGLHAGEGEIVEEVIEAETADTSESVPNGERAEEETYNIETAKETAEADSLHTSEQEERKTFTITGVLDTRTDEEVSLDKAVSLGIINQGTGMYNNLATKESYPIPVAMNAGFIKVEYVSTKKSKEKRRDVGLITIKTYKESRPYTVKGVVDAKTDKQLNIEEAMDRGVLDLKAGTCKNTDTDEVLNLADALDSGLLVVEFDKDAEVAEPEVITKTYAVHAVVNMAEKKRVLFSEAVKLGLIDQETGAYYDNKAKENIYIGDAIKKGLVKATVVHDPNKIDIAPENRMVFDKLESVKSKFLKPMLALSALKKAGKNGQNGNKANGEKANEEKANGEKAGQKAGQNGQ